MAREKERWLGSPHSLESSNLILMKIDFLKHVNETMEIKMSLTNLFEQSCARVEYLISERERLVNALKDAQIALLENDDAIITATRKRDSLKAAFSVTPEPLQQEKDNAECLRMKRRAVFSKIQDMPNVWIKPFGIAAMCSIETEEVCLILRRASKIDGIPLEHNGESGRNSMYRWVSEKKIEL
jgi:hypothetical protein